MINKAKIPFLLLLVSFANIAISQKPKRETLLGLHISSIITTNIIEKNDVELFTDSINYQLKQKTGINYGMEIRFGIGERLSLHTGINYTQRNFDVKINTPDTLLTDSSLKFISYEVPISLSGYVKLTGQLYLCGNLGLSFDFYPTNISIPHVYGKRYNWAQFAINGTTGMEFRTKNSGYIFLGASYHTHFSNMLYVLFYKSNQIGSADECIPFSGNYFSVNLKYYFPQSK